MTHDERKDLRGREPDSFSVVHFSGEESVEIVHQALALGSLSDKHDHVMCDVACETKECLGLMIDPSAVTRVEVNSGADAVNGPASGAA